MTITPRKIGYNIPISEDALMHSFGPDGRRGHSVNHTPPTSDDWARFYEAEALMREYRALRERMDASPCIDYDLDDGTPSATEPTSRSEWEWTETLEEWRKRIGIDRDTP